VKTIRMEEMNWPDVRAAVVAEFTTAVVAVGSTEQHGPHLPAMTDARIGDAVAHRVTQKLGNALQARTIPVGVSDHHLAFGATISLQAETLRLIVRDYVDSLVCDGFQRIVFLPLHGGNFLPVAQAIEDANRAHPDIDITAYTDLLGLVSFLTGASAVFGGGIRGPRGRERNVSHDGPGARARRPGPPSPRVSRADGGEGSPGRFGGRDAHAH
jgi:creatinine amidohydrolase/Fe(II)-dependent formamide hydrolase-like protein